MESFSKLSELTTVLPDLEILFQFAITVMTDLAISIEHFLSIIYMYCICKS